jgi:hypothetical protein
VALRQPLSRVQAIVGFVTGLVTIGGVILPLIGVMPRSRPQGELVAVVHDVRSRKPVVNATIEVLTLQDAIVTTLFSKDDGARYLLKQGGYRLRVTHPKYTTQVRQVLMQPGQRAQIYFALAPVAPPPPKVVTTEKVSTVKKLFRGIGL